MRKDNGKVADDRIQIKDHQVQTGRGSTPALDLFSYLCIVTGYEETCEVLLDYP